VTHRRRCEQLARREAKAEADAVQEALDDRRRYTLWSMNLDQYLDFMSGTTQFDFDAP